MFKIKNVLESQSSFYCAKVVRCNYDVTFVKKVVEFVFEICDTWVMCTKNVDVAHVTIYGTGTFFKF